MQLRWMTLAAAVVVAGCLSSPPPSVDLRECSVGVGTLQPSQEPTVEVHAPTRAFLEAHLWFWEALRTADGKGRGPNSCDGVLEFMRLLEQDGAELGPGSREGGELVSGAWTEVTYDARNFRVTASHVSIDYAVP